MIPLNWIDLVLIVGLLVMAMVGWRAGVITTAASFAGFIGGAIGGAWLAPRILAHLELSDMIEALVMVAVMLGLGLLGRSILGSLGREVRETVDSGTARFLDRASGMVVSAGAFLLSAWLLLSVAVAMPSGGMAASQVRESRTYPILDEMMSGPGGEFLDDARAILADFDLPSLTFNTALVPRVGDPADVELTDEVKQVAHESVVQVATTSPECGSSTLGSGVVVGEGRVATNAHVVTGARSIAVRLAGRGRALAARLIHLDRGTDLAILRVPDLDAPAPTWVRSARRGTDSVVAGFPAGGPLRMREARVRGQAEVADDSGTGSREVIVFRGLVQPGNSGGPLLDLDGRVIGLVFANSAQDERTGFALSAAEVVPVVAETRAATEAVSSGACTTA